MTTKKLQPEYNKRSHKQDMPLATVTLRGVATLTQAQRDRMAQWLKDQAAFLEQNGDNFSARYIARYHKAS